MDTNTYSVVPETYLEDDSFTLSYYFDTGFWLSFHDYIGNFRFATRDQEVYSFYDSAIWIHNQDNYCKFYGNDTKKSYITPTFTPQLKKEERLYPFLLNSINYLCNFFLGTDNFQRRIEGKTFSTISFHNSYQSTSEIPLKTLTTECNLKEQWRTINIRHQQNSWFFHKIFDETILSSVATLNEKFDEVISNVMQTTCGKRKRPFVDDFVIVKLTTDNADQTAMFFTEINFDPTLVKV